MTANRFDITDQEHAALLTLFKNESRNIQDHKSLPWKFNAAYVAITGFLISCLLEGKIAMLTYFGAKSTGGMADSLSPLALILIYIGFGFAIIAVAMNSNEQISRSREIIERICTSLGEKLNSARGEQNIKKSDHKDRVTLCFSVLISITSIAIYSLLYLKLLLASS